jgi:hypothetical protein
VLEWATTSKFQISNEYQIHNKMIMFEKALKFEHAIILCCGQSTIMANKTNGSKG